MTPCMNWYTLRSCIDVKSQIVADCPMVKLSSKYP